MRVRLPSTLQLSKTIMKTESLEYSSESGLLKGTFEKTMPQKRIVFSVDKWNWRLENAAWSGLVMTQAYHPLFEWWVIYRSAGFLWRLRFVGLLQITKSHLDLHDIVKFEINVIWVICGDFSSIRVVLSVFTRPLFGLRPRMLYTIQNDKKSPQMTQHLFQTLLYHIDWDDP